MTPSSTRDFHGGLMRLAYVHQGLHPNLKHGKFTNRISCEISASGFPSRRKTPPSVCPAVCVDGRSRNRRSPGSARSLRAPQLRKVVGGTRSGRIESPSDLTANEQTALRLSSTGFIHSPTRSLPVNTNVMCKTRKRQRNREAEMLR